MIQIEFYIGDEEKHITACKSSTVPRRGEFINIRRQTYKVSYVSWAIDHADTAPSLRANVVLEEPK